ncbi:MAG: glycosyltransferase family 2 protein [Candidatus Woesearchaeota archaeon]
MAKANIEVSIVMPCLNEENSIGFCVEQAKKAIKKLGLPGEVIVSDNGSVDRSVQIAKNRGARVVHQPLRGYGNAYLKGISSAKGKYIMIADSDKTYDFMDIEKFILPLKDEGYDMVMGTRLKGRIMPGAMPWLHKKIGNPILSGFLNMLFHTGLSDAHCGQRSFTKKAFEKMFLKTGGMEFASEMVINASKAGLRIKEVPITYYANKDRKPHLRSFRDGWRHVRFMLLYSPFHLFFVPGITIFLIGAALLTLMSTKEVMIGQVSLGPITAVFGSLLCVFGFQIILLSYFAKVAYSKISPFDKQFSGALKVIDKLLSIEKSLLIGCIMIFMGVLIDAFILFKWLSSNMGQLSLRDGSLAVSALTIIIFGMQIIFSAFLTSIIKME